MNRTCKICGETKPIEEFYRMSQWWARRCKKCTHKRNNAWALKNPDKRRAIRKKSAAKCILMTRQSRARWAKAHPKYWREYYHKNLARERVRAVCGERKRKARLRGVPHSLTLQQWRAILELYSWRCVYCGVRSKQLTQDHVVPIVAGGGHTKHNVVPACLKCNVRKGTKDAPTFQQALVGLVG